MHIEQPTGPRMASDSPPTPPNRTHHMVTSAQTRNLKPTQLLNLYHAPPPETPPTSYKTALLQPQWYAAMQDELTALNSQHTWTLVAPTKNQAVLGCK